MKEDDDRWVKIFAHLRHCFAGLERRRILATGRWLGQVELGIGKHGYI